MAGSSDYSMPWHWHDCLMFILPSRGTIELKHEDQREGTWLSQDRFAVVPPNGRMRPGPASARIAMSPSTSPARHSARLDREIGSLSEFRRRTRATTLFHRTVTAARPAGAFGQVEAAATAIPAFARTCPPPCSIQCIAEVMAGEDVSGASHREHGDGDGRGSEGISDPACRPAPFRSMLWKIASASPGGTSPGCFAS